MWVIHVRHGHWRFEWKCLAYREHFPRIHHSLVLSVFSPHPDTLIIIPVQLTCLSNLYKGHLFSFSLFKTKENLPMLTYSKRRKNSLFGPPSWLLLLPCSLWHTDRGSSDDMEETAWELAVHSRGNHVSLSAGSSSYFAVWFLLCDFERGLWMISKCVPRWGKLPGERVTLPSEDRGSQQGPRSAGTGSTLACRFLNRQNRNQITVLLYWWKLKGLSTSEWWWEMQNSGVSNMWTLKTNVSAHILILYVIAV